MKTKNNSEKSKNLIEKYTLKEKLLMSGLTSLAVSFMFFLFGCIDIYANNMLEFAFTFSDIIGPVLLVFFAVWAALFAFLMIFNKGFLNIVTAVVFGIIIASYVNNALIGRISFASGNTNEMSFDETIVFFIVYIIVCTLAAIISLLLKNSWKKVVVFLSVLIIGMNGASLVNDIATKKLLSDNDINCDYVLSNKGLDTVSGGENIVYILFDRFDTKFYDEVLEKYPDYFEDLEGFTLYHGATALYTRTYPSATYMITGEQYMADVAPEDYFDKAYGESQFLKDLKANEYNINIYGERYYMYSDAKTLLDIADNAEEVTSYSPNKKAIIKYFSNLLIARNFSQLMTMKTYSIACDGVIDTLSDLDCESGLFTVDDEKYGKYVHENPLTVNNNDKTYTFIHLHGCHFPYTLDENGEYSEDADRVSQTVGAFNIVKEYLNQLKALGVYDNSTIIIAGDHAYPRGETKEFHIQYQFEDWGQTTCLFFKPKNADNKELLISEAEVSTANIIPSIVQDRGLQTDYDYGKSLFDIKEGESNPRVFYFSMYNVNDRKLCFSVYEIKGNAHDINNWKKTDTINSDYPWY